MGGPRLIHRIPHGQLDRRILLEAMGALGLTFVLVPLTIRPAQAVAPDLVYYTWAGFDDPGLFPGFEEKHGGQPQYSFYGDEYEAIEKLKAGYKVDIAAPCIDVMPRWFDSGALLPIDETRLVHLGDIFDSLVKQEAGFHDGKRYFAPVYWGLHSIIYRTDLTDITPEQESWALLYDDRFKGRIAVWDTTDAVIPGTSLVLGYTDNPFTPSGERLDKVMDTLRQQRSLVRLYWTSPTDMENAFVAGEVTVAWAWASSIPNLKKAGVPFKWATPKEGFIMFSCGLALLNRGGDEKAAYDFMNASMSPAAGKHMIETFAFGSANRRAFDLVDPATLTDLNLSTPEAMLATAHPFQPVPGPLKDEHIERFDLVKAGG